MTVPHGPGPKQHFFVHTQCSNLFRISILLMQSFIFSATLGCGTGRVTHQWHLLQRSSDAPGRQGHREEALGVSVL